MALCLGQPMNESIVGRAAKYACSLDMRGEACTGMTSTLFSLRFGRGPFVLVIVCIDFRVRRYDPKSWLDIDMAEIAELVPPASGDISLLLRRYAIALGGRGKARLIQIQ